MAEQQYNLSGFKRMSDFAQTMQIGCSSHKLPMVIFAFVLIFNLPVGEKRKLCFLEIQAMLSPFHIFYKAVSHKCMKKHLNYIDSTCLGTMAFTHAIYSNCDS